MNLNHVFRGALAASAAIVCMAPAAAQNPGGFSIPPQPLSSALQSFGVQSRRQVLFTPEIVRGRMSPGVSGVRDMSAALRALLSGTGLTYRLTDGGTILIVEGGGRTASNGAVAAAAQSQGLGAAQDSAPVAAGPVPVPVSQAAGSGSEEGSQIFVTGSRLLRRSFDSPTPVVTLDRDYLETSGYNDITEALLDVPGVTSGVDTSTAQLDTQNAGLSTIDLRNIGDNRTLVLIDGRRTVSNSANSSRVSLSTIPDGMIDRVEIITGGASAVYGSDAIAGVVNIITERNFDGIRLDARAGGSTDNGAEELSFEGTVGRNFADGRGNVILSAQWDRDYGLFATDRERALRSVAYDEGSNILEEPDLSINIPGGRFLVNRFYYDQAGLQRDFDVDVNGYDLRPFNTLRIPVERALFAGKVRFDIADTVTAFVHAQYSETDTNSVRAPQEVSHLTDFGPLLEEVVGRIRRTNPFAPAVIAAAAPSSGIDFRRRLVEVGNRETENERRTLRFWAGLEGRIAGNWRWDLVYGYGRYEQDQVRRNAVNLENLRFGLNAVRDPVSGEIVCADAAARAAGCVPVNLFGVGSISTAAADYIRADLLFQPRLSQETVQANISGELLQLPAGPLVLAGGAEYRQEKSSLTTDDVTAAGTSSLAFIPEFSGEFDVKEAYVEIGVPLLAETAFAHELRLEGAVRVADYSQGDVGTVFSYNGRLEWSPIRDIRFRASYARAQRAPDLTEIFSPPRDDFDTVNDICDGVTATSAGVVDANCRADPGIAAAIAADGVFEQDGSSVFAPNSGNLDLEEETADTYTLGVVVRPIPAVTFSADYYNIRVKDAIGSISNANLLRECYGTDDPGRAVFCDEIQRDAEGQISRILNRELNLNELETSGLDLGLAARFTLGLPGRFDLTANYTHVFRNRQTFEGVAGPEIESFLGEVGTPKDSALMTLRYSTDLFSVRWRTRYTGPVVDSNERARFFAEEGITDPLFLEISSQWRHDIYASLSPPPIEGLRLYVGVNNIFDNVAPFFPSGTDSGGTDNYASGYDRIGRFAYVGASLRF